MILVRSLTIGAMLLPLAVRAEVSNEERVPGRVWMEYAEPEQAGFSAAKLAEARKYSEDSGSAAVMVIHDGAVLAHWGEIETRFMCHSVRKSFLSALYGIHVAGGTIDPERSLGELGIEDVHPLSDEEKQATVRDLLKSRSGVYHSAAYETAAMKEGRPGRGSHRPGTFYYYNNWDFNALATIFDRATGSTIFREFRSRLAEPLAMQDYRERDGYYHLEEEHSQHPAYPFRMSARDMARFGLLYLRNGKWGEKRVIPEDWVRESTRTHSEVDDNRGYGYLWWTIREEPFASLGTFAARGFGGHSIAVVPGAKLVLVHRVDTWWDLDFPGCAGRKVVKVGNDERLKLLGMILAAREGEPEPEPALVPLPEAENRLVTAAADPESVAQLIGTYEFAEGRTVEIVRADDDGLLVHAPRAGTFSLLPVAGGGFVIEDVGIPVSLVEQEEGVAPVLAIEAVPDESVSGRTMRGDEHGN